MNQTKMIMRTYAYVTEIEGEQVFRYRITCKL
jgi:hypothetical protein